MNPDQDLMKLTVRIFRTDVERLRKYFPNSGYNRAVRMLVKKMLDEMDARANKAMSELEEGE